MSNSVRPHRQQPARLPCPQDSPGKNSGVGCHFLLQCMKVKSESEVAQSCQTLRDPMDCSPPGSSIHGIFHARALECSAIVFLIASAREQFSNSELALCHFCHMALMETSPQISSDSRGGRVDPYLDGRSTHRDGRVVGGHTGRQSACP